MSKLKQLCGESPEFKKTIQDLVLSGPFDSFNSDQGRVYKARDGEFDNEQTTRRQKD